MSRCGFAYACVGRPLAAPAITDGAPLDQLLSIARVRASAPTL
jgi:hypothetical protein